MCFTRKLEEPKSMEVIGKVLTIGGAVYAIVATIRQSGDLGHRDDLEKRMAVWWRLRAHADGGWVVAIVGIVLMLLG
jgi:hypothetical protein